MTTMTDLEVRVAELKRDIKFYSRQVREFRKVLAGVDRQQDPSYYVRVSNSITHPQQMLSRCRMYLKQLTC